MKALNNLPLIVGVYTPEKAKDIILSLIESKIQFHQLNSFSSEVRFGKKDQHSLDRIDELKSIKKEVLKIIEYSDFNQKKLEISSLINIQVVDE